MTERYFQVGAKAKVVGGCSCGLRALDGTGVPSDDMPVIEVTGLPFAWSGGSCPCLRNGEAVQMISLVSDNGRRVAVKPKWLEPWWDGREPLADSETEDWIKRLFRPRTVRA